MIENNKNRFTDNETDCLIDSSFTDNLTKKIYVIDEWERIIGLCNNLWEQTQRFEKENQRLNIEIEQLKQRLNDKEVEWLQNNTVWEQMPSSKRTFTKTSIEYNKMTENKQIEEEFDKEISRLVRENYELKSKFSVQLDSLKDKNKNLKKENKELKDEVYDWKASAEDYLKLGKSLQKENKELKELLYLITGIFSFEKEESVKELLRNEIKGLDAVSYEFAGAWNDYCILSKFFQERYGEHWDNE